MIQRETAKEDLFQRQDLAMNKSKEVMAIVFDVVNSVYVLPTIHNFFPSTPRVW